jgi:hypothetical protein
MNMKAIQIGGIPRSGRFESFPLLRWIQIITPGEIMNKKQAMKKIDDMFAAADDIGIELIESEARKILAADPNLSEFIMAMGSCFFTIKEGGKYDITDMTDEEWDAWTESEDYVHEYSGIVDQKNFQEEFFDMVAELNEKFNSMGCPMRFTATSNIVTDWGDTRKDPVVYTERKVE